MKNKIKFALKHHLTVGALHKTIRVLFLQALTLILLGNMIVSCKSGNKNTAPQQVVINSDSLRISMDSLLSQFNASHGLTDQLITHNAALDSEVKARDAQIAKLNNKIKHLQQNNRSLAGKLKADNKMIASLKDELSEKVRSFAARLGLLENEKSGLVRQRDSLFAQYTHIKALGSVLHASDIRLLALHLKHHGKKEKNTKRARKADVLRVYFDIDENRIAEDGTKKLYLVIKDPDGNLLTNPLDGSGVTTSNAGSPLHYSLVKDVPLKQNEPVYDVSANWKQDNDYKKGAYSIVIYNGGYKIGSGEVVLN